MKKNVLSLLCILFSINVFSQSINIGLLNGPSCIPCAQLNENLHKIGETEVEYEMFATPQELLPKMIKKEIDIGFMPVNVAAKVYDSTNHKIICCGITGEGNLALITKNKNIKSLKDLKGKTVFVAGLGATPEYITKYILEKEGIVLNDEKGIFLDFSLPTNQIVPELLAGKIDYAIVPEPFITIASEKSKNKINIIDLQKDYFLKYFPQNYPLTVMVVRSDFAEENPDLLKTFLEQYKSALSWTLDNPSDAGQLCEKYNFGLKKNVVEKSIPKSKYVFIPAVEGKLIIESLLQLFIEEDNSFLNGKLPEDDFYYKNE